MKLKHLLQGVAFAAVLDPAAALAQPLKPVEVGALADARGGFVTAGGLTFGLGVTISTYVDGSLALLSTVSFTGDNPVGPGATAVTAPTVPTTPTTPTTPTSPTVPTAATQPTLPTAPTQPTQPVVMPSPPVVPATPTIQPTVAATSPPPITPPQISTAVTSPSVAGPAATAPPVQTAQANPAPASNPGFDPVPTAPPTLAPPTPAPQGTAPQGSAPPGPAPQTPASQTLAQTPSVPSPEPQIPSPQVAATDPAPQEPVGTVVTVPAGVLPNLVEMQVAKSDPGGDTSNAKTAVTNDGQTTIIHNLTPGSLRNLVVNTADNRMIQLDMQVDIVLPGFTEVQQQNLLSSMGMKLNTDGGIGMVGALR